MFPHVTLLLVVFLLALSTVASGGSISSSGSEFPLRFACVMDAGSLEDTSVSREVTEVAPDFVVERDASGERFVVRVRPHTTLFLQVGIEPSTDILVDRSYPETEARALPSQTGSAPAFVRERYANPTAGVVVDIDVAHGPAVFEQPHPGLLALWSPVRARVTFAPIVCHASMQTFR